METVSPQDWVMSRSTFTVPQIAQYLGKSNMTIYRKIRNGKLIAKDIFRPKIVLREDLIKFMEKELGINFEEIK